MEVPTWPPQAAGFSPVDLQALGWEALLRPLAREMQATSPQHPKPRAETQRGGSPLEPPGTWSRRRGRLLPYF